MMTRSQKAQAALDEYARLRALYAALGEKAGNAAAQRLGELAAQIVRIVGADTNAVGAAINDDAQLTRLVSSIQAEITTAEALFGQVYGQMYGDLGEAVLERLPRAIGVFGRPNLASLKAARSAFKAEARGALFNAGYAQWVDNFQAQADVLQRAMKRTLIKAQLEGWGQRDIARDLLRTPEFSFSNLPKVSDRAMRTLFASPDGLATPEALVHRAHLIARTEATAVSQRMVRNWTEKAGFDRYINVNVNPVAEECQAANAAGALTWAQWEAGLGIPPRHPRCDSQLVSWPEDVPIPERRTEDLEKAA